MSEVLQSLLEDRRSNALVAWPLVVFLVMTGVFNFLNGNILWAGWCVVLVGVAVLPAAVMRDGSRMVPWEVLALAGVPFLQRAAGLSILGPSAVNYVSAAAMALLVVVVLQEFTGFSGTSYFAVIFVTVSTVAWAGTWAVARWIADIYLGTSLLPGEYILMWEFTGATFIGVVAGFFFHEYLERRAGKIGVVE